MEAEKKTPENKTGEKKKRKLWPIFLIIGIVLVIAAILLNRQFLRITAQEAVRFPALSAAFSVADVISFVIVD